MEAYFNVHQLAKYLKLTEQAINRLVAANKIPSVTTPAGVVIFKKSDIDQWIEEHRKKAQEILENNEII